ncbi:MAG: sigma-70 family RNA polymerase sigma factor [Planctomycetota bacterium]
MIDWSAIVEQHGREVWRTLYRLLSDREDTEDCYQETFMQAMRFASRNEVRNWSTLLRRIATARAMDRLRRRYRGTEELPEPYEPPAPGPGPDHRMDTQEQVQRLRCCLSELPKKQAEVFLLREIEELSHEEIARVLHCTAKQSAVWLHRAKKKLRELMGPMDSTNRCDDEPKSSRTIA